MPARTDEEITALHDKAAALMEEIEGQTAYSSEDPEYIEAEAILDTTKWVMGWSSTEPLS